MKKGNILICTRSKGFSRFIKYYLANDYNIENCSSKEMLKKELSLFDYAFVFLNTNEDILDLFLIYSKIKTVFFCSSISEINDKLMNVDRLICINMEQTKKDLIDQIVQYLRENEDIESEFIMVQ